MTSGRELLWWSPAQLEAMAAALQRAWRDWQLEWLGPSRPGADSVAACVNAHELESPPGAWSPLPSQGTWAPR